MMSSHAAVFPRCAPSLNMADPPADRRSVQDFVRNVINAVTNLQTSAPVKRLTLSLEKH